MSLYRYTRTAPSLSRSKNTQQVKRKSNSMTSRPTLKILMSGAGSTVSTSSWGPCLQPSITLNRKVQLVLGWLYCFWQWWRMRRRGHQTNSSCRFWVRRRSRKCWRPWKTGGRELSTRLVQSKRCVIHIYVYSDTCICKYTHIYINIYNHM